MKNEITITRSQLYAEKGINAKFAWSWLYRVTVPGERFSMTGTTLSWARGVAKKYAAKTGMIVNETFDTEPYGC